MTKEENIGGFYKPEELAKLLGVSERTLSRWSARRIGPPRFKCGHCVGYRQTAVTAWLAQNEVQPVHHQGAKS